MMEPWGKPLAGRLDELEIDPHVRPLWVYDPAGETPPAIHRARHLAERLR